MKIISNRLAKKILLLFVATAIVACHKNDSTPAPTSGAQQVNATTNSTNVTLLAKQLATGDASLPSQTQARVTIASILNSIPVQNRQQFSELVASQFNSIAIIYGDPNNIAVGIPGLGAASYLKGPVKSKQQAVGGCGGGGGAAAGGNGECCATASAFASASVCAFAYAVAYAYAYCADGTVAVGFGTGYGQSCQQSFGVGFATACSGPNGSGYGGGAGVGTVGFGSGGAGGGIGVGILNLQKTRDAANDTCTPDAGPLSPILQPAVLNTTE